MQRARNQASEGSQPLLSLNVGEVRRYRKILALPLRLRKELMEELNKSRDEQHLTVDQVIEAVDGVSRLAKTDALDKEEADDLVNSIASKFRLGIFSAHRRAA